MWIASLILPYLYIVLSAAGLMYIARNRLRIEIALPFSILLNVLIVYFVTFIFHNITLGIIFSLVFFVAFLWCFYRDKDKVYFIKNILLTPGFIVFSLLFLASFLISYNHVLFGVDDYNQWGQHVKDMWLLNDFYNSPNNTALYLSHPNYPPAIQMLQITFVKISGFHEENLLFHAQYVLNFALFLPCLLVLRWQKRRWKSIALVLTLAALFMSIPLIISLTDQGTRGSLDAFYSTLNVDSTIGSLFCFGLFIAFIGSKKRHLYFTAVALLVLSAFMMITKEVAVIFVGIIWLYYVAVNWRALARYTAELAIQIRKKHKPTQPQVLLFMVALLPIVAFASWQYQIKLGGHTDQFSTEFNITEIPSIVTRQSGTEGQQCVARGFIAHLLIAQVPIGHNKSYQGVVQCSIKDKLALGSYISPEDKINLTYWQFWLIVIAVFYLIYTYAAKGTSKRAVLYLGPILVAGFIGYIFILYNTYLFGGFIEAEQEMLASVDRYLSTYLFAVTALILMIIMYLFSKRDFFLAVAGSTFIVLWVGVLSYSNFLPSQAQHNEKATYNRVASFANDVSKACKDSHHVYIITSDGQNWSMINYALRSSKIKLYTPIEPEALIKNKVDCLGVFRSDFQHIYTKIDQETVTKLASLQD